MKFSFGDYGIRVRRRIPLLCRIASLSVCLTAVHHAMAWQDQKTPTTPQTRPHASLKMEPSTPGDAGSQTQNILSSNDVPRPAKVTLTNGTLTVEANNSDLSQILKKVADDSGMVIEGSIKSIRVYGVYGPLNPFDVLTTLLTGSGYNFTMFGVTHQGAPRELVLTNQSGESAPIPAHPPAVAEADPLASAGGDSPNHEVPGPGAIVHVPPPPAQYPEQRMEQNMQRLGSMRDQLNRPK